MRHTLLNAEVCFGYTRQARANCEHSHFYVCSLQLNLLDPLRKRCGSRINGRVKHGAYDDYAHAFVSTVTYNIMEFCQCRELNRVHAS
jgi:hypothetical protein